MESLIIVVHVLSAVAIIGLVLIQHGKGADMGASFGSGASQTMFGGAGSGNALTKSTTWLAMVFFATSLLLAVLAKQQADAGVQAVDSLLANPNAVTAPVVPAGAASDLPSAAAASKTTPAPETTTQSTTVEPANPQQVDEKQATTKPVEPAR